MMAEMSRLAYFRFEGAQNNITEILESIKELTSDNSKLARLENIVKNSLIPSKETGKKLLGDILAPQGYELVETFNNPTPVLRPLSAATRARILLSSLFAVLSSTSRTSKQTSKPIWSRLR